MIAVIGACAVRPNSYAAHLAHKAFGAGVSLVIALFMGFFFIQYFVLLRKCYLSGGCEIDLCKPPGQQTISFLII